MESPLTPPRLFPSHHHSGSWALFFLLEAAALRQVFARFPNDPVAAVSVGVGGERGRGIASPSLAPWNGDAGARVALSSH